MTSSKTNQYGRRDVQFLVMRGTKGEDMLVECMSVWASLAAYGKPEDMFFSRESPTTQHDRRRLQSSMVAELVKRCAKRQGELESRFSTKSFKIGGVSSLKAMGEAAEIVMSKMDHRSTGGSRAYQRVELGAKQGPLAGGEGGFRTESSRLGEMLRKG